ncbi:MAG: hypothetical protein NC350_03155 [Corallococcus sp.]|nr:hypothetical protein [Corallococcus sp.]
MKKLNMLDKKTNIIITAVILAIALAIGVVCAVDFISFRNYEAYFSPTMVDGTPSYDEIQHFVDYSPRLGNSVAGNTAIYIKYGTENTVAVVKAADAEKYDTLDKIKAANVTLYGVAGSAQLAAAEASTGKSVSGAPSAEAVINALNDDNHEGNDRIAILKYSDAKTAIKDGTLVVAEAEVERVPKMLVMGGTHANEPAGQVASTVVLENAKVERGVLFIITEANRSGYTHTHPQEASPEYYHLDVTRTNGSGQKEVISTRTFKFGSRATNTVDQWPTPDIYSHNPSGQPLSASEVRNINRAYPGSENGNYTERAAYAVTQLVKLNNITITVDLHEASPEYSNINQGVYHQDSEALSGLASFAAEFEGLEGLLFSPSPVNLHGLTHRELGDFTNTYAFLFETSNASQGKYRGLFTEDMIITGNDKIYNIVDANDKADPNSKNLLYAAPVHIDERVARHVCCVSSLATAFNDYGCLERTTNANLGALKFTLPSYTDILGDGVGTYLAPAAK